MRNPSSYSPAVITSEEDYERIKASGTDLLFWNRSLALAPALRRELQERLFGKGNHQENNQKFYRYVWDYKHHYCEECCKPLARYSATYVSHIQSRGAHPESAYDPRNVNILCPACHHRWENGDRENMRIYNKNRIILTVINNEYIKESQIQAGSDATVRR